jgi:hypothetical protein
MTRTNRWVRRTPHGWDEWTVDDDSGVVVCAIKNSRLVEEDIGLDIVRIPANYTSGYYERRNDRGNGTERTVGRDHLEPSI